MKFTIAMLSLVVSANVFAFSIGYSTVGTVITPAISTAGIQGDLPKLQANAVLSDTQEMLQTGVASLFLSQKIRETQALNNDISEEEALDILIESAQEILSK